MRTLEGRIAAAAVVLVLSSTGRAHAQDEGADESLPPGHPAVESGNPHANAGGGGSTVPGMFKPPEDVEEEAKGAPAGTIVVDLRDADDKPVANEMVTLGMMINSIAKGDSRKHLQGTTDASGRTVFNNLDTASNVAYRVSAGYQGGAFAATPFQLGQIKAMHVVLHVYAITHDIQQALIVAEATVAAEMRDDRIQMEEVVDFYNLGRFAWQPDDVFMQLPEGATAFSTQANMSGQSVEESHGRAQLRGTFPPGHHTLDFRWQLPWSGDADVDFSVGMPPHVAIARVLLPAAGAVRLAVAGFPLPQLRHDRQGQGILVTEKRLRPEDPRLSALSIGIHDLPVAGPGRLVATLIAALGVALGVAMAFGRQSAKSPASAERTARDAILEELAELEKGRAAGEIGPKTYERAYRELIDALARTLTPHDSPATGGNVTTSLGAAAGAG